MPTKPTLEAERLEELRTHQVRAVVAAVAKLPLKLLDRHGHQFEPEAVFEGAVKGAAVQLIAARGLSGADIARLLEDLAQAFRDAEEDGPGIH